MMLITLDQKSETQIIIEADNGTGSIYRMEAICDNSDGNFDYDDINFIVNYFDDMMRLSPEDREYLIDIVKAVARRIK